MSTHAAGSLLPQDFSHTAVAGVVTLLPEEEEGLQNPFLEDVHLRTPNVFIATDVDGVPLSPLQRLASGLPLPSMATRKEEEEEDGHYYKKELFDSTLPSGLAARKSIFINRLQLGEVDYNNTSPSSGSPFRGEQASHLYFQRRLDIAGGRLRTPDALQCAVPATLVPHTVTQFSGSDVLCPDEDGVVRDWICSRCQESCVPRAMFCHGCGSELWVANV